jgi:hypothetical protein
VPAAHIKFRKNAALQRSRCGPFRDPRESLVTAWPQTVAQIAGTIVLFVAGYIVFQRQEVRA